MSASDIVTAARSWLGTPYHHQASVKAAGTDCLGLIRGVWREVYGAEPAAVPAYTKDWSEAAAEERLWSAARQHLTPIDQPCCGAVVLFRMRDGMVAKHLGIVSEIGKNTRFIHAYARHGVVESPFSVPWQRRVVAYFQFP